MVSASGEDHLDDADPGSDEPLAAVDEEAVDAVGYEPGDVNTLGGSDYEAGDVNTIAQASPAPGPGAGERGEMPLEVLSYLARALADDPEAVVVRREDRRGTVVLKLHVAPTDMGRVIGRRGRTAQAIRTLVSVAGSRGSMQTLVDIVDD